MRRYVYFSIVRVVGEGDLEVGVIGDWDGGGMFLYSLLIPPRLLLFSIFVTSTAAGVEEAAFSTTTPPSILCADGTCSSSTCGDDAN